jgi:hypothetical protein
VQRSVQHFAESQRILEQRFAKNIKNQKEKFKLKIEGDESEYNQTDNWIKSCHLTYIRTILQ